MQTIQCGDCVILPDVIAVSGEYTIDSSELVHAGARTWVWQRVSSPGQTGVCPTPTHRGMQLRNRTIPAVPLKSARSKRKWQAAFNLKWKNEIHTISTLIKQAHELPAGPEKIELIEQLFLYLMVFPDLIAEHVSFRDACWRKAHEFMQDPLAARICPMLSDFLNFLESLKTLENYSS